VEVVRDGTEDVAGLVLDVDCCDVFGEFEVVVVGWGVRHICWEFYKRRFFMEKCFD
jgi:hypothetical protein